MSSVVEEMNSVKFKTSDRIVGILFWLTFIGCLICAFVYFIMKFSDEDDIINGYENTDSPNDIESRQALRGQFASIISILLFSTLNSALDEKTKIDGSTSTALLGLLFGGTVGFVLDNFMGTDEGWMLLKTKSIGSAWDHAMSTLITQKFGRFLLTVVFDAMITVILYKHLIEFVIKLPFFRVVDSSRANLLTSMFIGGITFGAYANILRFSWAYPNVDAHDVSGWISGKVVSLVMTVVCVVFLTVDTKPNLNLNTNTTESLAAMFINPESVTSKPSSKLSLDINQPNFKLAFVLGTISALFALSKFELMDATPTYNNTIFAKIDLEPGKSLEEDTIMTIVDDDTSFTPSGPSYENTVDSENTFTKYQIHRFLTDTTKLYTYELETGDYEIISKYDGNIYKIQKLKEEQYDDTQNNNSILFGKLVFILIGVFTSTVTIIGTAKSENTTIALSYIGFLVYVLVLTFVPGFLNFKVMA